MLQITMVDQQTTHISHNWFSLYIVKVQSSNLNNPIFPDILIAGIYY